MTNCCTSSNGFGFSSSITFFITHSSSFRTMSLASVSGGKPRWNRVVDRSGWKALVMASHSGSKEMVGVVDSKE